MNRKSAITAIERAGILLVFPLDNRKEPASIWSHFFPRKKMRWEWDENGDDSVGNLWHLRGELSTTRKVVYTKWYRGRATYFSREVFASMFRALNPHGVQREALTPPARRVFEILEGESPVSTKELKRMADLKGRANERAYEKALQELWQRLLIVAFGEVEEGAFPSLAVGATSVIFEDLYTQALKMDPRAAEAALRAKFEGGNLFYRQFLKLLAEKPSIASSVKKESKKSRVAEQRTSSVIRFEDL